MKILMYGDSGVGKTTFMMSTYGLLKDGLYKYSGMKDEIKNFRIKCQDQTMHQRLERMFASFKEYGYYPPATDKMSSYHYNFYYDNDYIMSFEWADFKGETVNDTRDSSKEARRMRDALKSSDAIMLFLNSNNLIMGDYDEELFSLYANLNACVNTDEKRLLIIPVFTKCDELFVEYSDSLQEVWDALLSSISPLMEMDKRNDNLFVIPAPIGCAVDCMMDLDYVMLWLMLWGINNDYISSMQGVQVDYERAQRDWNEHSYLADIFGLSDKADRARSTFERLKKEIARLENIEKIKEEMVSFLNEYEFPTVYSLR